MGHWFTNPQVFKRSLTQGNKIIFYSLLLHSIQHKSPAYEINFIHQYNVFVCYCVFTIKFRQH